MDSQAFSYTSEEPYIAATLCAAEPEVSRKIQQLELEPHIFDFAASANELVTSSRKGRQPGLVKFSAGAGKSNGAVNTLNCAFYRGWGLAPEARPARYMQGLKDLKNFPPCLHLAAWKIGDWPVLMAGAQTTMSLGWIISYSHSFRRGLPQTCEYVMRSSLR